MQLPPELQQMIAQVRQQHPQLAHLPDEQVAELIMQAMEQQTPASGQDMDSMSANELDVAGQTLMDQGRWQEAEEYFFKAIDKGEEEGSYDQKCWGIIHLGQLCLQRGNFPQAMTLYQQALTLAERLNDRRLMGVIYNEIGETYRMQ
ncbi:MAG: tetratricopeptide repeat protein, partial [Gammaproteobacteria bacterium]|nr:tetratricopeptide repeat protein [Gammaproteobacteria bacterium]